MSYLLTYAGLGLLWAGWLEWYCTSYLEEPYNKEFSLKERLFHTCLWIVSLGLFIYNIGRDCLK